MLNYVGGMEGHGLTAAITFSSALDLFKGCEALEKWYNIALNKVLAKNLVGWLKRLE